VDASDRAEFLQLMRNSRHLHQPWISPPLTDLVFQQDLSRTAREDHEGLLVCQREDDRIVGVININNIVRGSFLSASLGYYAGAPYVGKGLMREGLELVKLFAFGDLGLHRLEANIQPDTVRSIALVQHTSDGPSSTRASGCVTDSLNASGQSLRQPQRKTNRQTQQYD
jgi:ribosomal-protein-alanine N-acetyltransferase